MDSSGLHDERRAFAIRSTFGLLPHVDGGTQDLSLKTLEKSVGLLEAEHARSLIHGSPVSRKV